MSDVFSLIPPEVFTPGVSKYLSDRDLGQFACVSKRCRELVESVQWKQRPFFFPEVPPASRSHFRGVVLGLAKPNETVFSCLPGVCKSGVGEHQPIRVVESSRLGTFLAYFQRMSAGDYRLCLLNSSTGESQVSSWRVNGPHFRVINFDEPLIAVAAHQRLFLYDLSLRPKGNFGPISYCPSMSIEPLLSSLGRRRILICEGGSQGALACWEEDDAQGWRQDPRVLQGYWQARLIHTRGETWLLAGDGQAQVVISKIDAARSMEGLEFTRVSGADFVQLPHNTLDTCYFNDRPYFCSARSGRLLLIPLVETGCTWDLEWPENVQQMITHVEVCSAGKTHFLTLTHAKAVSRWLLTEDGKGRCIGIATNKSNNGKGVEWEPIGLSRTNCDLTEWYRHDRYVKAVDLSSAPSTRRFALLPKVLLTLAVACGCYHFGFTLSPGRHYLLRGSLSIVTLYAVAIPAFAINRRRTSLVRAPFQIVPLALWATIASVIFYRWGVSRSVSAAALVLGADKVMGWFWDELETASRYTSRYFPDLTSGEDPRAES